MPEFNSAIKFLLKLRTKPCIVCSPAEQKRDCLSDGLYCPLKPLSKDDDFKDFYERVPGRALLMQSLLTKCVHLTGYQYASNKGAAMAKSLQYMINFAKFCASDKNLENITDFKCAEDQMRALEIDE